MKKIAWVIMLCFILPFIAFQPAYASELAIDKIVAEVNQTNELINKQVQNAIVECNQQIDTYQSKLEELDKSQDAAVNQQDIKALKDALDQNINAIIDNLVTMTNREAQNMIDRAAKAGVTVECKLVKYEIGGQQVWIDPLRVAGW